MILITGSTGNLGRGIIDFLLKKGMPVSQFIGFARNQKKADELLSKGVKMLIGNYDDHGSLVSAMKGIDVLMMISGSEVDKRIKQHENIVRAAKVSGVGHVFYTSFHRKNDNAGSPIAAIAEAHMAAERTIMQSDIPFTFLRNALYADVVPMFLGENAVSSGIYFPAGNGKVPFALRSDIAEATAELLMNPGMHTNRIYSLVNTVNYSFYDLARILSDITGKNVTYTSPSDEQFITVLSNAGLNENAVNASLSWAIGIREGYFEADHSDLQSILGRKPAEIKEFLKRLYPDHP